MERKCPQCGAKMHQTGNEKTLAKGCILGHNGDGFLYHNTEYDLTAFYYVCHNCGLVQQYIPDGLLNHIKNIEDSE